MKIPLKYLLFMIILIILIPASAYWGYKFSLVEKHSTIEKEVMLERVKNVVQLGTVEGVFSEIFKYSDYYSYDISPFRKKALIKIRAHVLIGYDLDSIDISINRIAQKVVISQIPDPRILSIDHELEYYDITEGTFNSFTQDDYNMLQKQSKDFIRKKALESDLFDRADKEVKEHLNTLNWLMEESGWEIEIKERQSKSFWN